MPRVTEASRAIFIYHALSRLLLFLNKIRFIIYLGLAHFIASGLGHSFFFPNLNKVAIPTCNLDPNSNDSQGPCATFN